jgi:hypothetical protein
METDDLGAHEITPDGTVPDSEAPAASNHSRRWWLLAPVAIVSAGALLAGILIFGSSKSAEAAVVDAAAASSQQKTGALSIQGSVQAVGKSIDFNGSGKFDLDANAASIDISYSGAPPLGDLGVSIVFAGDTLYEGGTLFEGRLAGGKSWIALPTSQFAASSSASETGSSSSLGSPAGVLAILSQHGSTVTDLGSGSVDGVAVERYKVVPSQTEITRSIEQSSLPASVKAQALALLSKGTSTFTVSIDQTKTVREISINYSLPVQGQTIVTQLDEKISDWGLPVSISPPPAGSVCNATLATLSSCIAPLGDSGSAA